MFGLPLPVFGLSRVFSIALCVHVWRTHQQMYWIWLILAFQSLGGLIYFIAVILPSLNGGPTARRMGAAARETLDPGRDYRQAKALWDDSPTVQNGMKLAEAAAGLGRWDEAERLYAQTLQGFYADDPALLQGRARALIELGRPAEALEVLTRLAALGGIEPPQAALVRAHALEALGRLCEAAATNRKVTDTTSELANVVAQFPSMSASDVSSVMTASTQIMAPHPTSSPGIVIRKITTNVNNTPTVTWSQAYNSGKALTPGASVTMPTGLATPSTSYMLIQTSYVYTPTFGAIVIPKINMADQLYILPRQSTSIPYTG